MLNMNNIIIANIKKNVIILKRLAKMPLQHTMNVYVEDGAIGINDPNEGIETLNSKSSIFV